MVDEIGLKPIGQKPCGFESHRLHQGVVTEPEDV